MNIRIQVINPGFVDTPLTEKIGYPLPGVDAGRLKRACRMMRGIRSGGFEVTFPRRLTWCAEIAGHAAGAAQPMVHRDRDRLEEASDEFWPQAARIDVTDGGALPTPIACCSRFWA